MAISFKKPVTNEEIQIDNSVDEFDAKDLEIKEAFDKSDEAKAQAAIEAENLKNEQFKQDAYAKDLADRKATAEKADAVRKESAEAYAIKQQALKDHAFKKAELRREEIERFNYAPEYFKNLNLDKGFINTVKEGANERTLTPEARKAFNEQAKSILNEVSEKTVDLRNGNFASERPAGSSQVIDKNTVGLLQSGDRMSTSALIMTLEQRAGRLNEAHETRIEDMKERAEICRDNGDTKKADYYNLKIQHEEAAYERDRAKNVLSQYEFMDSDRGETDRIREQRAEIKSLSDKADTLYEYVKKAESFDEIKNEERDQDYAKLSDAPAEFVEFDPAIHDDFSDLMTDSQLATDESDIEYFELYENDSQYAVIDEGELAEFRADDEIQRMKEGYPDEEYDHEPSDDAGFRDHEDSKDRHNDAIESGRDETVDFLDSDPDFENDEDTRSEEEILADADREEDVSELRYEMKNGQMQAVEVEADEVVSADDGIEFEQPNFDDDTDIEAPRYQIQDEDRVFNVEELEEFDRSQTDSSAHQIELKAERKDFITDNQKPDSSSISDDAKFRADYNSKLNDISKQIDVADKAGDFEKVSELASKEHAINKEFNNYLGDREALNRHSANMDSAVVKLENATTDKEASTAKAEYSSAINKSADNVYAAKDKPWGESMKNELKSNHSANIEKLDKDKSGKGQDLKESVIAARREEDMYTVAPSDENIFRAKAEVQAEAAKEQHKQSETQH